KNESVRIANRQQPKQRLIDQRKEGRVRSNAQANRQDGGERESAVVQERPKAELQLVSKVRQHVRNRRPVAGNGCQVRPNAEARRPAARRRSPTPRDPPNTPRSDARRR